MFQLLSTLLLAQSSLENWGMTRWLSDLVTTRIAMDMEYACRKDNCVGEIENAVACHFEGEIEAEILKKFAELTK